MSVRIVIECEDYWVADSLHKLGSEVENTSLMDKVYNAKKMAKDNGDHYTAKIEYIEDKPSK